MSSQKSECCTLSIKGLLPHPAYMEGITFSGNSELSGTSTVLLCTQELRPESFQPSSQGSVDVAICCLPCLKTQTLTLSAAKMWTAATSELKSLRKISQNGDLLYTFVRVNDGHVSADA